MSDLVGSPDILMVWPGTVHAPEPDPVEGYSVQVLRPDRDSSWIDIHRKAVPSFGTTDLLQWLARYRTLALTDGILVAVDDTNGEPVATAGTIANDKDRMFPDGGQLAWVATVPEHRERGLAGWLSALATARLVQEGFDNIFLCTGDDLTAAIRVYLKLGYIPCLYASDQRNRWETICREIEFPFEPDRWPTPQAYLAMRRK